MMKLTRRTTLAMLAATPFANAARADVTYSDENGLAIRGTDPVAYFAEGAPIKGSAEFETDWKGGKWRFASSANRDKFLADPEAFAPQYGGFCAFAMAFGSKAATSPDAWRIVDGKLYLNISKSIQKRWMRDIPGFIATADANWPELQKA